MFFLFYPVSEKIVPEIFYMMLRVTPSRSCLRELVLTGDLRRHGVLTVLYLRKCQVLPGRRSLSFVPRAGGLEVRVGEAPGYGGDGVQKIDPESCFLSPRSFTSTAGG